MSQFILGLTGGIASGKTQASDYFASRGVDIVDADVVARDVVKPGSDCLHKIIEYFGEEILLDNGELNRAELREHIFADEQHKLWLNQLMHPAIRQQMLQQLQSATSPYVILVAPLLVENNLTSIVDRVLVIDVDEATQISRTMSRDGVEKQQAIAILASQTDRVNRLKAADDVVNNSGTIDTLEKSLATLHNTYLALANLK